MPHKLRKSLIRNQQWHRKIGLGITIMVLFLAFTGVTLNHSPALGLAKKELRANWLLHWYGFKSLEPTGVQLYEKWLSQPGGKQLFLDDQPVTDCQPPLLGAAALPTMLLALCQDGLVMLTVDGELIEKIDPLQGLPKGTDRLQVAGDRVLLGSSNQTYAIDLDTLALTQLPFQNDGWNKPQPIPSSLAAKLAAQEELPGISLETLILDLHSGRFFGAAGVLFVDLIGILLCVLAITGVCAWNNRRKLNGVGR
ncbi:PepSY domain-containing protein [Porticoccus sp.]